MEVDVKGLLAEAEEKMELSIMHLEDTLARIRAGKASARLLEGIFVDYYGSSTPLANIANISTPDARTISIQPWEKTMIREIEKAIMASDLGITPDNNGEIIRLGIPSLTEERRRSLTKQAKAEVEDAKISVRNTRRDLIEKLKKAVKDGMPEDVSKDGEGQAQKAHDKYIKRAEELYMAKEKEIMTV